MKPLSSPSRVLATAITRRPSRSRHACPARTCASGRARSNFRLPVTTGGRAPACANLAASSAVCVSTASSPASASRITLPILPAWRREDAENRALTSAMGTPASRAAASKFGQISRSINSPQRGRRPAMKRRVAPGKSYGSQAWCNCPCAMASWNSRAPSARPVAVTCVSSTGRPRSSSACSKGWAARVSPRLTACTQTGAGWGAGESAAGRWPNRSREKISHWPPARLARRPIHSQTSGDNARSARV
ncbi:hypothetical protein D9M68_648020 [compost metagenome]